jgi:hypothetical protein
MVHDDAGLDPGTPAQDPRLEGVPVYPRLGAAIHPGSARPIGGGCGPYSDQLDALVWLAITGDPASRPLLPPCAGARRRTGRRVAIARPGRDGRGRAWSRATGPARVTS